MSGEQDLDVLLASMEPVLVDGVYVFATTDTVPAGLAPRMVFQEAEGTTLIYLRHEAEAQGLDFAFPSRMITLNIHSSLDAVGFMARIATELAKAEMGVNPVAGFYHDHIFIPDGREEDALRILRQIAASA